MSFLYDVAQRVRIDNKYSVFNGYVFPVEEDGRRISDEPTPRNMYYYRGAWFYEEELIPATPNDRELQQAFTEAMQAVQGYELLHCDSPLPLLLMTGLYVKLKIDGYGSSELALLRNTYVYSWMLTVDNGVKELCQRVINMMTRGEYKPAFFSPELFRAEWGKQSQRILIVS